MRLLLDTHVWIWTQVSPGKVGRQATRLMLDAKNINGVATISALEIARLIAHGDIVLHKPLDAWVEAALASLHAREFPLTRDIALEAYRLPEILHRDPADRILVATARVEGMTLVTADTRLLAYSHVKTVDARK